MKGLPLLQYVEQDNLFFSKTSVGKPEPISIDNTPRNKKRYFTDSVNRDSKTRSKTFGGIAEAMAEQWIPILNAFEKSNAGGKNFKNGQISTNAISEHERSTCN